MRSRFCLSLIALSLAAGLGHALPALAESTPPAPPVSAAASPFASLTEAFLDAYWRQNPDYAVGVGYYRYADRLRAPDAQYRAEQLRFGADWLKRFAALDETKLDAGAKTDLALIRAQLEAGRWYLETFKSWQWDPSQYNVAEPIALLLNTEYAPLPERLATVSLRLAQVPAYYAAAQGNIQEPTREHTALAIQQSEGTLSVLSEDLLKQAETAGLTLEARQTLGKNLAAAQEAVRGYIAFLKTLDAKLAQGGARDFRIGKALYEPKFQRDIQAGMSAEQLYQRALEEKERLHAHMDTLADQLWSKYMKDQAKPADRLDKIGQLIKTLSADHVAAEQFFPEIKKQIPVLEAWVRDKKLMELDPSRPLVVRETPEYMRGIAGASISAPGPYDPKANTYYNVTPLDGYDASQAESYLREYNRWILQVLNIHEAVPGHYVQLLYSNKSPSRIKSLFGNGAMVEGWAVYSERMMLESGYGGDTPEMWLMYSKWNLRVVCNSILDYGVHVLGMSEADALKLLTREAFQSETEAKGKWRRVQLTSVQLTSYFTGYAEIYDFREQLKKQQGKDFDLKAFHERFLSFGSAPVSMIKGLMTAQP
ncbi:MAG: DUF885 domain-containing protein [Gammaproteobacteria bacterium]|nr:DUF885 domain-containing protein [Gammaproteobacteria bacterium]